MKEDTLMLNSSVRAISVMGQLQFQ